MTLVNRCASPTGHGDRTEPCHCGIERFMALDFGRLMGVAIYCDDKVFHETIEIYPSNRPAALDGHQWRGEGFAAFRALLVELIDRYGIQGIYYEEVAGHIQTGAMHAFGGYKSILEEVAYERKIAVEGVFYATIKKSATGSGRAKKAAMMHALDAMMVEYDDDNDADALHLLNYAMLKRHPGTRTIFECPRIRSTVDR